MNNGIHDLLLTLQKARGVVAHRGLGYIPDNPVLRASQQSSRLLLGSSPTTPANVSVADFEPDDSLDQGPTGSCTGGGTSHAVYVSAGAAGQRLARLPSPRVWYGLTRILELPSANDALQDNGAMPTDLITVGNGWGMVDLGWNSQCPTPDGRNYDVWDTNVNVKPNLLDVEQAGVKLLTGTHRVDETAIDFGAQLKAAIGGVAATPCAAGVGIFVDTVNFMQWDPRNGPITRIDTSDPQGGGHWLATTYGYTHPTLGEVIGGLNTWNRSWPRTSISSVGYSPFWKPGRWEMTLACLRAVCSDCLLFPYKLLSLPQAA